MSCDTNAPTYEITPGETKTWLLYITKATTKHAQNLDGCQIHLTIKARYEATATLIYKRTVLGGGGAGEITPATPQSTTTNTGKATVTLLHTDTVLLTPGQTYVMDAWVVTSMGERRPVLREQRVTVGYRVTVIP